MKDHGSLEKAWRLAGELLMRADPLDSTGKLEATVAAAIDALAAALRRPVD